MNRYQLHKDAKNPYRIALDDPGRAEFFRDLITELQLAIAARNEYMRDGGLIDQWQAMYEQTPDYARMRDGRKDFASWMPTVYVDSLADRVNQVVFGVEPICMVEGWPNATADQSASPDAAAKVEAFHEWQADNERLRLVADKLFRQGLIEGNGLLEVSERKRQVKTKKTMRAAVQLNEHGAPALDDQLRPIPRRDEQNRLVPHMPNDPAFNGPEAPSVDVSYDETSPLGDGPEYNIISTKHFLYLPVHAKDEGQVYGFARRFFLTVADCLQLEQAGTYDGVDQLGTSQERLTTEEDRRLSQNAQEASTDDRAMKELWQVSLRVDIDGDGIPEWVIATVSLQHNVGLQLAFDDLAQTRYLSFTPFPRSTSVWGMSMIAKMWTTIDEHTCWRNLSAEAAEKKVHAPILRQRNSSWKPEIQPWGTENVIDVNSVAGDLAQFNAADVPEGIFLKTREVEEAGERQSGLNDVAMLGGSSASGGSRGGHATATEVQTDAHASYVRVQAVVDRAQEFMADWYYLRHTLWKRALGSGQSLTLPFGHRALKGLESRGIFDPANGPLAFTAQDLEGTWRFKPRGSVETADVYRLRDDYIGFIENVVPALMKLSPSFAQFVASNPAFIKACFQDGLRLFRMEALQTVMNQLMAQFAQQQALAPLQPPAGLLPPGAPAGAAPAAPGAPPAGPGGPMIPGAPGGPQGLGVENFAPSVMPSIATGGMPAAAAAGAMNG